MTEFTVCGKTVVIDDEDRVRVLARTWTMQSGGYVLNQEKHGKGPHPVVIHTYLHRFVLNYNGTLIVDHINHNPLDNRKANLRLVTQKENQLNRKMALQTNNNSGVTGVLFQRNQGWTAYIQRNGKKKHLGTFENYDAAVAARKQAELKHIDRRSI